jgi:hypothetical protein
LHENNFETEIESLNVVLDRLDEAAMSSLRRFIETKDPSFRTLEKRIHRARRSVARAVSELEMSNDMGDSDQYD